MLTINRKGAGFSIPATRVSAIGGIGITWHDGIMIFAFRVQPGTDLYGFAGYHFRERRAFSYGAGW